MIGIYKITSTSKKVYIGQSVNIIKRFNQYKNMQNVSTQKKLYNSLKKYTPDCHVFEIIEECEVDKLNERERYWQEYYDATGKMGLNCYLTEYNDKVRVFSKDTRLKMSNSAKGKVLSEETKKKIGIASSKIIRPKGVNSPMYGKVHTEETKKLLSQRQLGLLNHNFCKKASIETRIKMSNSKKGNKNPRYGTKHSEETKLKIKINRKPSKTRLGKKVKDTFTGVIYLSAKDAAISNGINLSTLNCYLNGRFKNKTNLIYV